MIVYVKTREFLHKFFLFDISLSGKMIVLNMVILPAETQSPIKQEVTKGVDDLLAQTRQLKGLTHQEQWSENNNPNRHAATSLLKGSTSVAEMLLTIETKSHADPRLSNLIDGLIEDPKFKSLANIIEGIDTDKSLSFQLVGLLKTIG